MESPSISKYLVQDRMTKELDNDVLHRKGFNVNMRLFKESTGYRKIVLDIIMYMEKISRKKFSDYPELKGISGANIGIPLNIIGFRSSRDISDGSFHIISEGEMYFMINPEIAQRWEDTKVIKSNCGSIRLPEKIDVKRTMQIEVKYCDIGGKSWKNVFHPPESFVIQHEVDHNLGVLVTDIEHKETKNVKG